VPAGCRFTARCDVAIAGRCAEQMPVWTTVGPGQKGLCHRLTDAAAAGVVVNMEGTHG
jgi:ABC-type dipeptide/oligopeptide/nickel transport system ATPase component